MSASRTAMGYVVVPLRARFTALADSKRSHLRDPQARSGAPGAAAVTGRQAIFVVALEQPMTTFRAEAKHQLLTTRIA